MSPLTEVAVYIGGPRKAVFEMGISCIVVLLLSFGAMSDAHAQNSPLTTLKDFERAPRLSTGSTFVWKYRDYVFYEPVTASYVERTKAKLIQASMDRGNTREEAEKATQPILELVKDCRPALRVGTKTCSTDGTVAKIENYTEFLQRGDARKVPIARRVTEYSDYIYQSRYYDPKLKTPGEIDIVKPGTNIFGFTVGTGLDPYVLCMYPFPKLFGQSNLIRKDADHIILSKVVEDGGNIRHFIVADWNATRQLPCRLEVRPLLTSRPLVDYQVLETTRIDGVDVPSYVLFRHFRKNGALQSKAELRLVSASLGPSPILSKLSKMGPPGVTVVDSRFGKEHQKTYVTLDHFLTDREVLQLGTTVKSNRSVGTSDAYVYPAECAAIIFFGIGIIRMRNSRKTGPG